MNREQWDQSDCFGQLLALNPELSTLNCISQSGMPMRLMIAW